MRAYINIKPFTRNLRGLDYDLRASFYDQISILNVCLCRLESLGTWKFQNPNPIEEAMLLLVAMATNQQRARMPPGRPGAQQNKGQPYSPSQNGASRLCNFQ